MKMWGKGKEEWPMVVIPKVPTMGMTSTGTVGVATTIVVMIHHVVVHCYGSCCCNLGHDHHHPVLIHDVGHVSGIVATIRGRIRFEIVNVVNTRCTINGIVDCEESVVGTTGDSGSLF